MTWGETIKQKRLEKGMSKRKLAKLVGVKENTIANWEGRQDPPAYRCAKGRRDAYYRLADFLEVNTNTFMGCTIDFRPKNFACAYGLFALELPKAPADDYDFDQCFEAYMKQLSA